MQNLIGRAYARSKHALSRQVIMDGWTRLEDVESTGSTYYSAQTINEDDAKLTESTYHDAEKGIEESVGKYTEEHTEKLNEKGADEKGAAENVQEYTKEDTDMSAPSGASTTSSGRALSKSILKWRPSKAIFRSWGTPKDPESKCFGLHLHYAPVRQFSNDKLLPYPHPDGIDVVIINDLTAAYERDREHTTGAAPLQDLLPNDFPRAHIFSFTFHAEAFFEEHGLLMCGYELLQALKMVRDETVKSCVLVAAKAN